MNDFLTYNARAKIKHLISNIPGCLSIEFIANPSGGLEMQMLYARSERSNIIISNNPYVLTDEYTFKRLNVASIDFNYDTCEFEIKQNELSTDIK